MLLLGIAQAQATVAHTRTSIVDKAEEDVARAAIAVDWRIPKLPCKHAQSAPFLIALGVPPLRFTEPEPAFNRAQLIALPPAEEVQHFESDPGATPEEPETDKAKNQAGDESSKTRDAATRPQPSTDATTTRHYIPFSLKPPPPPTRHIDPNEFLMYFDQPVDTGTADGNVAVPFLLPQSPPVPPARSGATYQQIP